MLENLEIHPKTFRQLNLMVKRCPQAIILEGKPGVGLHTIASELSKKMSEKHSILQILPDDKNNIKIDVIRQLYGQTRTKRSDKLIVLIDDADAMLAPAQNALLKLLEDTPKDVVFLLTTHFPQMLLPTIRSRSQKIEIHPIGGEQTNDFLKRIYSDKKEVAQILFLGQGLPAELYRLTHNKEYFSQRFEQMSRAKNFLNSPLYEKLVIIYKQPTDRLHAQILIQDLMRITETTLKSRADQAKAILLDNLLQAEEKLQNDGHVRTQMLYLAVSIATP